MTLSSRQIVKAYHQFNTESMWEKLLFRKTMVFILINNTGILTRHGSSVCEFANT